MGDYVPQSLGEFVIIFLLVTIGAVGRQLVDGVIALLTGKQAEERTLLAQYRGDVEASRREVEAARKERDESDTYRRQMAEHASSLRYHLLSLGIPPERIEPFPKRNQSPFFQPTPTSIIKPPKKRETNE